MTHDLAGNQSHVSAMIVIIREFLACLPPQQAKRCLSRSAAERLRIFLKGRALPFSECFFTLYKGKSIQSIPFPIQAAKLQFHKKTDPHPLKTASACFSTASCGASSSVSVFKGSPRNFAAIHTKCLNEFLKWGCAPLAVKGKIHLCAPIPPASVPYASYL